MDLYPFTCHGNTYHDFCIMILYYHIYSDRILMKRLLIPVLILSILFSGCISGDDGTYEGELEDLLIAQENLPKGYVLDNDQNFEESEDELKFLDKYGFVESLGIRYLYTISEGDPEMFYSLTTPLEQQVSRFDKEGVIQFFDYICQGIYTIWGTPVTEQLNEYPHTFESYEHETIGDLSYLAIVNMDAYDPEDPDYPFTDFTSYQLIFIKKDVAVKMDCNVYDGSLGAEELIDVARDIADRI